jgi:acyl-CoA synthetase (AMP-forming)/AMP-acid ligase II
VNVAMLLEMVAEGAPDRLVVGSRADGLTAAVLLERARAAAAHFTSLDVAHVAFIDVNSDAVPVALFGAALAGLPFAPINYRLTDAELDALLARLTPCVVIAGREVVDRIAASEGVHVMATDDFMAATTEAGDVDLPFVDPDEVAVLLFTSGTTGEPKAAVLRHRHLASYVIGSVEYLGADDADAQLVSVPPYHVAGVSAVLSGVYGGRRLCYLPSFDADTWVKSVNAEAITQAMVVPTMLGRVLDALDALAPGDDGAGMPSLRHLSYGGGRMPIEVIERAMTALPNVNFVNAYGLTETSSTVSVLTPDDHREAAVSDDPTVRARLGSVGQPLPTIELEIRDADGKPLGAGERGEIYVRGEQVAGEYLGRSMLDDDGWLPTNDAGHLDDAGFLYLEGRLDDVIVRGAENLSPSEIEDVLLAHPAIVDAAVVGVPDAEWGEAVAAAVVIAPGDDVSVDDLQTWVRERLRSSRTPEVIEFRAELPYSETGKLLRRVIRAELRETSPAP